MCVDFKVTVNKCIEMEHYSLPLFEEMFEKVEKQNKKCFCTLDSKNAYLQMMVNE